MGETMQAGRELDGLIETKVFGRCHHTMACVSEPVLRERLRDEVRQEWVDEYESHPPEKFVASEVESRLFSLTECDYPPKECTECGVTAYGTALTPRYSTDIAAAWLVIEKVDSRNAVARGLGVRTFTLNRYDSEGHSASFFGASARATTAPLAICLAALAASGVAPQEGTHGR